MLNKLHEIKNERRIETCKVEGRLLAYKNAQEMKGNQFQINYDDNDESIRIILDKDNENDTWNKELHKNLTETFSVKLTHVEKAKLIRYHDTIEQIQIIYHANNHHANKIEWRDEYAKF